MENSQIKNVVAITACPTGVTQTFMAAEAIMLHSKKQGWNSKVETRGQVVANNSNNELTAEEITQADLVFIAADIDVDLSAFKGKPVYRTSTRAALKDIAGEFEKALTEAKVEGSCNTSEKTCCHDAQSESAASCAKKCPCSFGKLLPIVIVIAVVAIAICALS